MGTDYTKTCPLKIVTLTLDNGDKIPMVAQFDSWNKAWFSNIYHSACGECDVSFSIRRTDSGYKISDLIAKTVSADVDRFYFGILSVYSTGEVCQHIIDKKIGEWDLLEKTIEKKYPFGNGYYLDVIDKNKTWNNPSCY